MTEEETNNLITVNSLAITRVGLLGAKVDPQQWEILGSPHLVEVRLAEIERRILDIEAQLLALSRKEQP